ncbi:type II toxin-antitoxin system RelE/ParE family toxin [Patescibacteria group bacterium]|nr:type II toxin-antitoxin system RelE/ParE family toxin [Patescibacteria group bacterium]
MFQILPLSKKVEEKVNRFSLQKKFRKQLSLLSENPSHPSLNTELLEPKEYGIYSFRIDLKYRALFIFHDDKKTIEVLNITAHYR